MPQTDPSNPPLLQIQLWEGEPDVAPPCRCSEQGVGGMGGSGEVLIVVAIGDATVHVYLHFVFGA